MRSTLLPLLLSGCFPAAGPADSDPGLTPLEGALIVKAAGPPPGEEPADHPDAITAATTDTFNTHVFAEGLAARLEARGMSATVVDHFDCPELDCASGSSLDALVFAGPTWLSRLPSQVREMVEPASELSPVPVSSSALASCESTGQDAVDAMLEDLGEHGLETVEGVSLASEGGVTQEQVDAALEAFAVRLAP